MNGRPWTQDELARLERMRTVLGMTFPAIAAALGRSVHSVMARCALRHWCIAPEAKRANLTAAARNRMRRGETSR